MVTEKLMTYALGRGVEYYDMPVIRSIVHDADKNNDKLTSTPEDRAEVLARCWVPEHWQLAPDSRVRKTSGRKRERQEILVPYAIFVAEDRETLHLREILAGAARYGPYQN
jgi:Protein of unknown function (DUF1585)